MWVNTYKCMSNGRGVNEEDITGEDSEYSSLSMFTMSLVSEAQGLAIFKSSK